MYLIFCCSLLRSSLGFSRDVVVFFGLIGEIVFDGRLVELGWVYV